jgi:hypothetical protein
MTLYFLCFESTVDRDFEFFYFLFLDHGYEDSRFSVHPFSHNSEQRLSFHFFISVMGYLGDVKSLQMIVPVLLLPS